MLIICVENYELKILSQKLDRWMDGIRKIDRQIDKQIDRQKAKQMERQTLLEGWVGGLVGGWIENLKQI